MREGGRREREKEGGESEVEGVNPQWETISVREK